MKKQFNILLMFLSVLVLISCSSIKPDSAAVPHSVEKYLLKNGNDFIHYKLSDTGADNDYKYNEQSYNVYEDIETVWLDYMKTAPLLAFDSRIIDFGIVFNPDNSVVYNAKDSSLPPFIEGQIYILNLKFLGVYGIPIAFKLSKIDPVKKMIEFIYMKNNLSTGFQQIYLKSDYDSEGIPVTNIEHVSFFKTEYSFTEIFLYPPFHRQTIDSFHKNIFKLNRLSWDIP